MTREVCERARRRTGGGAVLLVELGGRPAVLPRSEIFLGVKLLRSQGDSA